MGEGGRRWEQASSLAQITSAAMGALSEEILLIPAEEQPLEGSVLMPG